ncbi:hypothetical protein BKA62DRAFT_686946 [Auriculariales sp. MPI-PUGE-AT-0066]|nr:hypothetical protein BKA62DRAFT_686946 [Auriculariales sp. MPI-PUGE-AT-0066]
MVVATTETDVTSPSPPASPAPLRPRERRDSADHHPYAIKTTSTALLTRSNSTGTRPTSMHLYSPKVYHKSSKSASNGADGSPMPLPMPPSPARSLSSSSTEDLTAANGDSPFRRSSTVPSLTSNTTDEDSANVLKMLGLPENPKLWTPSHLANYLTATLRFKGDAALPARIAQDLSGFVYTQKLTGRVFLRLTDSDLDDMAVNALWREALLSSSRALRKRVLQGRIWGFGSSALLEDEDTGSVRASRISRRFPSTVNESEEGDESLSEQRKRGHARVDSAGRVRAMAATFERTPSQESAHRKSRHSRVDADAATRESEEEILSASDISDFSDTEVASVIAAAENGQPVAPEISAPDIAVVEAGNEKEASQELSMNQLLAREPSGNSGVAGWDFDADNEGENGTAKRLIAPATTSRAGSRRGTTKGRPSTIGRKNGAPLADLFRDGPEPPAIPPATPSATVDEVEALRARVAELEARVDQLVKRDEETRALLAAKEDETERLVADKEFATERLIARKVEQEVEAQRLVANKDAESQRVLAEARKAHEETRRILAARDASDTETRRLLEENRAAQLQIQVAHERHERALKDDQAAREKDKAAREKMAKDMVTPYIGQLPAYVALVGVGLCAVIFRTLTQKFSGRR